ncbi:hypothetical protein ACHAXA_011807 [Cyclostephanos tholiformis]|uniref:Uncharacterized protein n=1 Tax=Cyclostephanos tholiformis TaxID=382380 RepID=A0ABD3RBB9_9STRA
MRICSRVILPSSIVLLPSTHASSSSSAAAAFTTPSFRRPHHHRNAPLVRPLSVVVTTTTTATTDDDTSYDMRHDGDDVATPESASSSSSSSSSTKSTSYSWRARRDCIRPDVRDVERISWGMPAKRRGTGSRGVPHRLNDDERDTFDRARRDGYLQVTGSGYRSQRRDAPLLNTYRNLMDARGRPMVVLHKLGPGNIDDDRRHDRLVVDLSPLRLPGDFRYVGMELRDRIFAEFGIEVSTNEAENGTFDAIVLDRDESDEGAVVDDDDEGEDDNDEDDWAKRPIYQLSPHYISWGVSRQQGKRVGKYIAYLFNNVEGKGHDTKTKPKGVKPGKGRRHGGYGIG